MRTSCGSLIPFAFLALGCGPKDVIPSAPDHPANLEAAIVRPSQPPEPPMPDAGMPAMPDSQDDGKAEIAAAEKAAYERAQPVFQEYCAKCHSSSGKKARKKTLAHFNMDTYPFGGHHAEEIGATIRKVLGVTGKKATMPKDRPGSVKGEKLEAIVEWSKAFDKAHAAGLHEHSGHGAHH